MKRRQTIITSPARKRRRRRKHILHVAFYIFVSVFVAGIIILFFRLPYLRVSHVTVNGTQEISQEDIVQQVKDMTTGDYLFFFPKDHVLLYPKKQIISALRAEYPQIVNLSVSFSNANTSVITLKERTPAALYCTSSCYFMDDQGFVYKDSSATSSDEYLDFRDLRPDFASSSSPIGTLPLPTSSFLDISRFAGLLSSIGLPATGVSIIGDDDVEVQTKLGTIKVSLENSLDDQLDTLKTVVSQPVFVDAKGGINTFNYIDVRFGNKVFYKMAGTSTSTTTVKTASSTKQLQ